MKLLVVGSFDGKLKQAVAKITAINSKNGPFDLLICVGDLFSPDQTQQLQELEDIQSGVIKFPVPTLFSGGRHPLTPKIAEFIDRKEGQLSDSLTYLGHSGILTTADKLKIAFMGGSPKQSNTNSNLAGVDPNTFDAASTAHNPSHSFSVSPFFTDADVQRVISMPHRTADQPAGVDILLTHGWPVNIIDGSKVAEAKFANAPRPAGVQQVADLVSNLAPRYHFAVSESVFLEREPFYVGGDAVHPTRFIGLGLFGAANKERWFYAVNITPLATIDLEQLKVRPALFTPNPLKSRPRALASSAAGQKRVHSNQGDDTAEGFFFGGAADDASKRQRRGPPATYVCRKCSAPGHWIQDCPLIAQEMQERQQRSGQGKLPDGYICKICNIAGHHIRDCPAADASHTNPNGHLERAHQSDRQARARPDDPIAKRDASQCWFCLSNPQLEMHLIVAVVNETYVAVAKGGLVPGHILVVPVGHFPSTRSLQLVSGSYAETARNTLIELVQVQDAARKMEAERGNCVVGFEVYAGGDGGSSANEQLHHLHLQLVPIPLELEHMVENAFKQEADRQGLELVDDMPESATTPYVRISLSDHRVVVFAPSEERLAEFERQKQEAMRLRQRPPRLFNLQIGRQVIAGLLGKPDRTDWKRCILSKEEETAQAKGLQELLKL
eukprot:jgi/Hompol1/2928/HPOL_001491-RA